MLSNVIFSDYMQIQAKMIINNDEKKNLIE